jgi:O-antigen ligase
MVVTLGIAGSGNAGWFSLIALGLVSLVALVRLGPVANLYLFAGLIWLLPRAYVPGTDALVPLHVVLAGGLGVCWVGKLLTARRRQEGNLLPPFWPLVAIYIFAGFVAFFTGRADLDTTNGVKYLVEACLLAPLLYLLVWHYLRSTREAERLLLILSGSILALGILAFTFQGTGFWTPIPFEKEGLRLSGQYQFGPLYLIVTPVMMGTELSMLIPALAALTLNSERKAHRVTALALVVPIILLTLLAAGRSGWLGAAAGLVPVLFFSARAGKVSLPKVGLTLAAVGLIGGVAVSALGLLNDEIARRLLSIGNLLDDDTVVFRYWIWGMGIDLIREYPLGVGFQVIRVLHGYPAHNQYILWAMGTGLIGFGAMIALLAAWLGAVAGALWRIPGTLRAVGLAAFGGVAGALISINGDNISTSVGWTQSSLWIFLALGAAVLTTVKEARSPETGSPGVKPQ